jgi:pimeloyl-ACP methyl ester carboxylesterase
VISRTLWVDVGVQPVEGAGLDVAGPVGAPAIVLVHGAAVNRKMWAVQLARLADEYRVIAPDLPGHGGRGGTRFRLDAAAREIGDLLAQAAPERALLVGASLGGYVAIVAAHQRPDVVSGLVLAGCSTSLRGLTGLYLRVVGVIIARLLDERRLTRALERRLRRMMPADLADSVIAAGTHPRALGEVFAEIAGKDFAALLRQLPMPVLVVNGERDRAMRRGEAALVASLQWGTLRVIPSAGHAVMLERPAEFNDVLRNFARSVTAGR